MHARRDNAAIPAWSADRPGAVSPPDPINLGTPSSQDGSSVLLPLLPSDGYRPLVLLCGGQQPVVMDLQPLLDDPGARPTWSPTAADMSWGWTMATPRTFMNLSFPLA